VNGTRAADRIRTAPTAGAAVVGPKIRCGQTTQPFERARKFAIAGGGFRTLLEGRDIDYESDIA
jgi:hypothetical protein